MWLTVATTFLEVKNNATGALSGAVNDTDDPVDLVLGAGEGAAFPDAFPFHVTVENEILSCTSKPAADTLRCTRAAQSTTAASHASGVAVELRVTAKSISDLNTAVGALEDIDTDAEAIAAVPFVIYISFGAEPITGQSYAP